MTASEGERIRGLGRAEPFVHRLRVRYSECDMQGHVFNAHYLTWFDIAHGEMWRAALGPYEDFVAEGFDIVVAEARARFRRGARFDEEVDIEVSVAALTTSSLTTAYAVRRDDEVLCDGELRHVCVGSQAHDKRPWPDRVRDALGAES